MNAPLPAEKDELERLAEEVKRIISDNRKFLSRVMEEDFEPDEPEPTERE